MPTPDIYQDIEGALVERIPTIFDAVIRLDDGVYCHLAGHERREGWLIVEVGRVGSAVVPSEALAELDVYEGDQS